MCYTLPAVSPNSYLIHPHRAPILLARQGFGAQRHNAAIPKTPCRPICRFAARIQPKQGRTRTGKRSINSRIPPTGRNQTGRRHEAHAQCLQERDTAQRRPLQSRLPSRCGQAREAESRPGLPCGPIRLEIPSEKAPWRHRRSAADPMLRRQTDSTFQVYRLRPRGSMRNAAHPIPEKPQASRLQAPEPPPRRASPADPATERPTSPRPNPSTAPPSRNSGTSDPTSAAMRSRSSSFSAAPSSRSNPSNAAAAFADPAPRPPCTGSRFSIWISTSAATSEHRQRPLRHLPRGIARIRGHALVVRGEHDARCRGTPRRHRHQIMQRNRLIDRRKRVIAIRPRQTNCQAEIDLRKRAQRDRHAFAILSSAPSPLRASLG